MIDLKRYAGTEVVVQLKDGERWFVWKAPTRASGGSLPEIVTGPNQDGDVVPIPMPFIQGKVTTEGSLLVNTGNGGVLSVELAAESIASVSHVVQPSEDSKGSGLIIPGN
jgi:hypothetical protein